MDKNKGSCRYRFYCDKCHWSKYSDGTDIQDLVEVKTAKLPGGIPKLGPDNKIILPEAKARPKRFKCPKCGFTLVPKKLSGIKSQPVRPEDCEQ